jgi:hypothetical protein
MKVDRILKKSDYIRCYNKFNFPLFIIKNYLNVRNVSQNKKTLTRPFWIPGSNYFALTFSFAVAVFFIILGVLHEENEDFSFVFAGICFCAVVVTAVVVRGKLLLRYQMRLMNLQENFSVNVKKQNKSVPANKLSLEQNNAILKDIERKSKAADVLGKLTEAHWEVFELCNNYLEIAEKELATVGAGSPRIPALRSGSKKIRKLHKHHLMVWAANESKLYTQESRIRDNVTQKIESGNKALSVLESALHFYPNETQLLDSIVAVKEFILSTKVSNWIEEAEKAKFNGDNQRAIMLYRDALFQLARENVRTEEKDLIAEKINFEIDKLRNSIT